MRRIFIILSIVSVLPFAANAQLSKLMSKYHEKNGVTVTQLDKSLYGLYQRNNLPPEANELLQKLEEVNILNLDLNQTDPSLSEKAIGQFREILDKPEKGVCIFAGSRYNDENQKLYHLLRVEDDCVYNMTVGYPDTDDKELDGKRNYYIDCLYRMCSFSGGTYKPRTYDQFLSNDMGTKK